jgi:hypothetical protein
MTVEYKYIEDLNNSMVAAQQVSLGQIISYLSGSVSASGIVVPTAAATVVSTGLNSVGFATVAFSGSVSSTNTYDTVSGSSAGNILIRAWKTSGSSLTAATTGFTKVAWTAYGT